MREAILSTLRSVRYRQRALTMARVLVHGLLASAILAIVLGGLRLSGLWSGSPALGLSLLMAIPAGAVVLTWLRSIGKSDWCQTARVIDRHYELNDRTETALSFLDRDIDADPWVELQLVDTIQTLQCVEPRDIIPAVWPKSWRWVSATAVVAIALLFWPAGHDPVSAGPVLPIDAIVAEAEVIQDDLRELLEQLPDADDPEVKQALDELLAKAEETQQPGVDVREALAKLSEMQSELQALAAELNVAATDEQLKMIGEALQSSEALKSAGEALQKGEHNHAADELTKLDNPQLDRKEARAVNEKLKKSADSAAQRGLKKLGDSAKQIAEGLDKDDSKQTQAGLKSLADNAKQQANRKQVSQLLKKQSDKLGEAKGNIQANTSKSGQRPSQEAGKGSNSETQGARTDLDAKHHEEKIQGQKGEQGDGDIEKTSTTTETDEQSKRQLKEVYHQYRKLSEAVLDAEDIPLGHRQTIRRYFEAIRPTNADSSSPN